MEEKELHEKLEEIRSGVKMFDLMINNDGGIMEDGKYYLDDKQVNIVRSLFSLFRSMNWQLALNSYKKLTINEDEAINIKGLLNKGCGTPVKVRPCAEKYGNKTYFGILIGDVALSVGASIDDSRNLTIKRQMYNPGIFVPELKEIIYGCGSWWGEIESEDELNKLITDDTIKNVWYMKMLNGIKSKETS